jgi:hypothetical protein
MLLVSEMSGAEAIRIITITAEPDESLAGMFTYD